MILLIQLKGDQRAKKQIKLIIIIYVIIVIIVIIIILYIVFSHRNIAIRKIITIINII